MALDGNKWYWMVLNDMDLKLFKFSELFFLSLFGSLLINLLIYRLFMVDGSWLIAKRGRPGPQGPGAGRRPLGHEP